MAIYITESGSLLASPLTTREREMLELVREGMSHIEIAKQVFISPGTVKKHLSNIYKKLGARNRIEALKFAGLL